MRSRVLFVLVLAFAAISGCGTEATTPTSKTRPAWGTGFWFWNGSSADVTAAIPVDFIYSHTGTIERASPVERQLRQTYGSHVGQPPPAREYWFVFRWEERGLPDKDMIPLLAIRVGELIKEARRRNLPVAGIQLDIDSPTAALRQYGALLRDVRSQLPSGVRLSITALLDWFRKDTGVGEVLKHVDEFVPQFYDTSDRNGSAAIAAPIDAAIWGPVFERTGKPYRIGVSSFGRARFVSRNTASERSQGSSVLADLTPLDVAMNPVFRVIASRTAAQEMVLHYEASGKTEIGWTHIEPGERFEFIFPTTESMAAAVRAAKSMGGRCTGVVFFRWPAFRETMAAQPDQVLRAAGVLGRPQGDLAKLHVIDKQCSAVHCSDLYVTEAETLSARPLRYEIRSSAPLEYLVPADKMPVRMSGADVIELSLPPFVGSSRFYVGRAVTAERAKFHMAKVDR